MKQPLFGFLKVFISKPLRMILIIFINFNGIRNEILCIHFYENQKQNQVFNKKLFKKLIVNCTVTINLYLILSKGNTVQYLVLNLLILLCKTLEIFSQIKCSSLFQNFVCTMIFF